MADVLREAFTDAGIPFLEKTTTNQIFPILTNAQCAALRENMAFQDQERVDAERMAVRFVTSWATREEDVRAAAALIRAL